MEKIDIKKDFVISNLFRKYKRELDEQKISTKGLRKSLELIGDGEIIEKSEYNIEGDNLMYKEFSKDQTKIFVVHAQIARSPYGGPFGYAYEIGVYLNDPSTIQIGGGYGTSGIIQIKHTSLFAKGFGDEVYFNENIISKVCDVIKDYFDFSIKMSQGGSIGNKGTFKSLGSAKELGIKPDIKSHDMIAICDCGGKFSYQNSKKNIPWQCPECNKIKRIKTV